ncbi:MAG: SMP-30/gluconolactonase/LRE family protein [Bryobacteraceae bacterium]
MRALAALACALAAAPLPDGRGAGNPASRYAIDKIASGFRFTEGPAWSRDGYLVFSDVPSGRILRLAPGQPAAILHEGLAGPSGNAFDPQGRLNTCETRGRRVVRAGRKEPEVLAAAFEGKRLNAPNDLAIRKDGHIYFTDPAFGSQSDTRELDFYGVYHLTPRRELKLVARPAGRPNGIAISPDGRTLYVANSDEHNIRAYDLDGKGDASGERVLVSGIPGVPGGLRVDEKGNLWLAAKGVAEYSPQGKLLREIELAEAPSNLAFGDGDLKTIYVTARTSVYRIRPDDQK